MVLRDIGDGSGEEVGVTYGEAAPLEVTNLVTPKKPP